MRIKWISESTRTMCLISNFACLSMCAYVCVHVHVCGCPHIHGFLCVWREEVDIPWLPYFLPLICWHKVSEPEDFKSSRLTGLGNKFWGSFCLCLQSAVITTLYKAIFYVGSGAQISGGHAYMSVTYWLSLLINPVSKFWQYWTLISMTFLELLE